MRRYGSLTNIYLLSALSQVLPLSNKRVKPGCFRGDGAKTFSRKTLSKRILPEGLMSFPKF